MTGFTDDWLTLREPADVAARGAGLGRDLLLHLRDRSKTNTDHAFSVLDLGAGTGSNFRYLAPHLGHQQQWCLVDHDEALIEPTRYRLAQWAPTVGATMAPTPDGWQLSAAHFSAQVCTLKCDLATGLATLPWDQTDLLTGSALLDLVSQDWLECLAVYCQRHACVALFALTYDGRVHWHPAHAEDELMRDALNRHQQTDKGFGQALGPLAASTAIEQFSARQFRVQQRQTDWQLDAASTALQRELASGWAAAVSELDHSLSSIAQQWLAYRLARLIETEAMLTVGHVDFLATPGGN